MTTTIFDKIYSDIHFLVRVMSNLQTDRSILADGVFDARQPLALRTNRALNEIDDLVHDLEKETRAAGITVRLRG